MESCTDNYINNNKDKDKVTLFYLRSLCHRQGRLKIAAELTKVFAFFSVLGAVELNIDPGDADETLVLAYVSITSLFVANTVLIKLAVLWISPQLRLAMLLAKFETPTEVNISANNATKQFSTLMEVPLDSLALILDIVWLMASAGGFVLFGIELVLAAWIKFGRFSDSIPLVAVSIMGPTLFVTSSVSAYTFYKDRKYFHVFNEKKCLKELSV